MAESAKDVVKAPLECGRYENYGGGLWLRKGMTEEVGKVRLRAEDIPLLLSWMMSEFPDDMAKLLGATSEKRQGPPPAEDEGVRSINYFRRLHNQLVGTGISADKAADIVLQVWGPEL